MARAPDQAKRVSILKAARTILLRDGYAAAKMSDIATEAGVAPGTLYLYFENKEALAGAIGEELLERVSSQFLRVIKKLDTPEGVLALLDWSLKVGRQEREVFAMMKQTKASEKGPPPG
jgi:AcrR family transcriptional regulator